MSKPFSTLFRRALRSTCRVLAVFIVVSLVALAVLWAATRIYQYRVERLYARVLRLRVGKTGLDDVRQLANDYRGNVEWSTRSSPADWDLTISLHNTTAPMPYFDLDLGRVGKRPAIATVYVKVRDGQVSYVSFQIDGMSPSGHSIRAAFHAAADLTMFDKCGDSSLGRNSTYAVQSVPHRGLIETAFGSRVTEEVRARATDLRIECFAAAIRGCDDVAALMPRAHDGFTGRPDCDKSFTTECQGYVHDLERGEPPWEVQSAFSDTSVKVYIWTLHRCEEHTSQ